MKGGGQTPWNCHCHLRNVQDLLADEKAPYERRFGEPFRGPIILFGAMVDCHPSSPKDLAKIHQLGKKVLPAIFLGHELIAGRICKGDSKIAGRSGRNGKYGCIVHTKKKMMISYLRWKMVQQNCQ